MLSEFGVFKVASVFYLSILQRCHTRDSIPYFLDIFKGHINKSRHCAEWFILQFSNYEILKEIFLDCEVDDMRRFVLGLIYCAMLKLYEVEKDKLNSYWKT